jgi:hypothetical protein
MTKLDIETALKTVLDAKKPLPRTRAEAVSTGAVTATTLAQMFRMDRNLVTRRLTNCPSVPSPDSRANRLYDIATAARYLVTPILTPEEFVRVASKVDLPPTLQAQFWDAMLKRQRYEEQAGALWPTNRVRDVLGNTFQTIKFTMQLWVDTIEREQAVAPQQRDALIRLVDSLQRDIYEALLSNAEKNATGPQLADLPAATGEVATVQDDDADGYDQI